MYYRDGGGGAVWSANFAYKADRMSDSGITSSVSPVLEVARRGRESWEELRLCSLSSSSFLSVQRSCIQKPAVVVTGIQELLWKEGGREENPIFADKDTSARGCRSF